MDALRTLARGLADVAFPPVCVHCRGLVEDEGHGFRHVCARCAAQISYVQPPHCHTCGHPFYGVVEGEHTCEHCEGLRPVFGEGRTAVLFRGAARALVHELKYHRGLHVVVDMTEIFRRAPHVLELARGATLVPVPLHPHRERERGYNQAHLLAAALAQAAGGEAQVAPLLRRVVHTSTQTAHNREERMANLKNAFALAPGPALNSTLRYLLVDDVFTTGSTLNSCARALRDAGALTLDVATFGHG